MFLVRLAFWITVVALLLPTPDGPIASHAGTTQAFPATLQEKSAQVQLDMTDVANAAVASAEDVLGFCDRNPAACETGLSIAGHVQKQVFYYSARAFSWLAAQGSDISNSSVQAQSHGPSEAPSASAPALRGA